MVRILAVYLEKTVLPFLLPVKYAPCCLHTSMPGREVVGFAPGEPGRASSSSQTTVPQPWGAKRRCFKICPALVLSGISIVPMKAGGELVPPCLGASPVPTPPSRHRACPCNLRNHAWFEMPKSISFWRTVWLMGTVQVPLLLAETA